MKRKVSRRPARQDDTRFIPSKTMIETARTAKKTARVMGHEFFGVTALSLVAGFGAAGWWFAPKLKDISNWEVILIGGLGVAALGIQNTLMRGALKSFPQTTMMTGNLAQFTIDFVERVFHVREGTPRERELAKSKAGAALGAWLTKEYGLLSSAVPTGILFYPHHHHPLAFASGVTARGTWR